MNGALAGSQPGSAGEAPLADYGSMGIGHSHTTRHFDGDVAEFVIFNRELLPAERASVEKYLQGKYALSQPVVTAQPHTNFAIRAGGETIALTRPDGTTADSVPVPALPANISYGRSPDATGSFAHFLAPTPGTANTGASYGPPAATPLDDGISNLLRYALDLPMDASAATLLPEAVFDDGLGGLRFRFDPGKLDIAYVVECSTDMEDWSRVLFDSRTDSATDWNPDTPFTARESEAGDAQFYRLRVLSVP